ncbi:MAG: hypothetical protein ACFFE8_07000 [Candidatus Heimdallarchaeota archaeon]
MFRKPISLLFILLILATLIIPLYSLILPDTLSHSSQRLMASNGRSDVPLNTIAGSRNALQAGIVVSDGETNLTTDKKRYSPGDWVEIEANSRTNDMNGSLEWYLESPVGEVAFGFNSSYQDIFQDPLFDNNAIPDWATVNWTGAIEATNGFLNLTKISDADLDPDEIYFYNPSNPIYGFFNPRYLVSFDYFSQGSNFVNNSGFENGLSDWSGDLGNVSTPNEPENASEGNSYAKINATEGQSILYQNITSWTPGRLITFSAKATGTTNANYWRLKIEAFNSTGHLIGSTQSSDSLNQPTDDKGYVFLKILRWLPPENTTKLRASFSGLDSGPQADGFYSGSLDEVVLAEVPPTLVFSYWGKGNKWVNTTLTSGTHEWDSVLYDVELAASAPPIAKTFRFILQDGSDLTNITTAYWNIDNIAVNFATKPGQTTGISQQRTLGEVNSTWFHRGYRENLTSQFNIKADSPDETGYADSHATIRLQLPSHQIYFGSWIFVFKIHQEDDQAIPIKPIRLINLSFIVQDAMNFVIQDTYLLRGSTNQTINNASVFTEYFEQETSVSVISPGDNVTLLGFLEANSTPSEWYDLDFLKIGSLLTEYTWQNPIHGEENITWTIFGFIANDRDAHTLLDGNFSAPLDNKTTLGLNFQVPKRGIFGNISGLISFLLISNNSRPGGVGGIALALNVSVNLPDVKFNINITAETLPSNPEYVLTDYIDGNISLDFLNFNDNLEDDFPNRNITSRIGIPIKDLRFSVFLDDLNNTPVVIDLAQRFHFNTIGQTILWLDRIDPHLTPGFYSLKIRWETPFILNVSDQAFLPISEVVFELKGSLTVQWSVPDFKIEQGDQTTINFSVLLADNDRLLGGLRLVGLIESNTSLGDLVVYEESGVYKIDIDTDLEMALGNYSLMIKIGNRNLQPPISFEVVAPPISQADGDSLVDLVIGTVGFGFFILVSIIFVGFMLRFNRSIQ